MSLEQVLRTMNSMRGNAPPGFRYVSMYGWAVENGQPFQSQAPVCKMHLRQEYAESVKLNYDEGHRLWTIQETMRS